MMQRVIDKRIRAGKIKMNLYKFTEYADLIISLDNAERAECISHDEANLLSAWQMS